MKKTRLFTIFLAILLLTAPIYGNGQLEPMQGTETLVVLHTNDFHGHPLPFYDYPAPGVGGLPAIATLVGEIRSDYENVLVLDAGDINTGRPESNFFEAAPDIIGYNYVGYDAMAVGNHEFDKPLDVLAAQRRLANFPFLSANVIGPDGRTLADSYLIKDFGNLRVGIFGLTTTETEVIGNPDIIGNLRFEDEVVAARRMVAELEPQVDVIIALVHLGLYDDNSMGSRRLAAEVSGIDLIVDGHSHSMIDKAVMINGTPIVTANQWGLYLGKAVLTITDGRIAGFSWEKLPVNLKNRSKDADGNSVYTYKTREIEQDPYLLATLTPYAEQVDKVLSEVIGQAGARFPNGESRLKETAIGNLVADSMLWYTRNQDVDFAIQNGGGVRADLAEGEIAKRDIYEILPFDNSVMVLEMTGAQIIDMFDFVVTIERGKGAFPQVSSEIDVTFDFTTGETRDLTISGKPVDPNKNYRVATNSYMAAGGDGYSMMTASSYRYDTSAFQRDVTIDYIIDKGGTLMPKTDGRIRVIE